jgi:hypothetical protein
MADATSVSLELGGTTGDEQIVCRIQFADRHHIDLEATFRIIAEVTVHRDDGMEILTGGDAPFVAPTRGIVLFEKTVGHIPARALVEDHFADRFTFGKMFDTLYPPFKVRPDYGIGVHWEVQLLHPKFYDHELVGPTAIFAYEDFLTVAAPDRTQNGDAT